MNLNIAIELCVVLFAGIAAVRWPIANQYHPMVFFSQLSKRLVARVNPDPSRAPSQLKLSGALTLVVWIAPWVLIAGLLRPMLEVSWLFDGLILYICLSAKALKQTHLQVAQALAGGHKLLAKDWLSDAVLRDVAPLSRAGICKASIESYGLNSLQQFFVPLFWFMLGNSIVALAVTLLLHFYQQSNPKMTACVHFSALLKQLVWFIVWPPSFLFTVLVLLFFAPSGFRNLAQYIQCPSRMLLFALSCKLKCQLSGPAIYQEQTRRFARISGHPMPQAGDISRAIKLIESIQLAGALMIVIILLGIMIFGLYPA